MGHKGCHALISVDGTDCSICEPWPFDPAYWSHKTNGPALRYEIGVCLQTGFIVWLNGPYKPCSWPDLRIFRHRLMHALGLGEWIVADGGYRDGYQFVIPKHAGPSWLQDMTALACSRHETINSRFKKWKILSTHYRHELARHEITFSAIANMTQLSLMESPAFEIYYDDVGFLDQYLN